MIAILQVADQGPLESLVVMFRSQGIDCALPDVRLRDQLKKMGCDTVLSPEELEARMGYDRPIKLPLAGVADMSRTDVLYVDVKGHRNGPIVWQRWPSLKKRTLWYRINGGKPEHVIRMDGFDCGDEVNPPCPVLTPNQWYRDVDRAYTCWPPFYRFDEYLRERPVKKHHAICLIHNLNGWGYGTLVNAVADLGVKCFGLGSPSGLLSHSEVGVRLTNALAMVHLKSSDAPGYAIYEAMAAGCPIICTRRLIWRCRMQDLLQPDVTCLVFDRETHDELTGTEVVECRDEVAKHLEALRDPDENKRIGENGRLRLQQIMWNEKRDGESLQSFLKRNYQ